MSIGINTNKLLLRPIRDTDIEHVFKGLSHPDVIRYYAVSFSSNALSLPCLAALTNVSCAVLSREFFGGLKKVQCGQISASCFQFAPSLSALSRDCTSGLGDETLSALSLQQVSTLTNVGFSGLSAHHFVALVKKHGKQKKGEKVVNHLTPIARSCRAR